MAKTNFKQLKSVENIQLNTDGSIVIKLNQEESPQTLPLKKEVQFEQDRISKRKQQIYFKLLFRLLLIGLIGEL